MNTQERRRLLALYRERAMWLRLMDTYAKISYDTGRASRADDYSHGYAAAIADVKAAEHGIVAAIRTNLPLKMSSGPKPGDYPGGAAGLARVRAAWDAADLLPEPDDSRPYKPGRTAWLAGPPVHRHRCQPECHGYDPGWYTPAEAAAIVRTLP